MRIAYICCGSGQLFGTLRKSFVPIRPHLLNDVLREFCATQCSWSCSVAPNATGALDEGGDLPTVPLLSANPFTLSARFFMHRIEEDTSLNDLAD
jgi:hypothetical protein